VETYVDCGGALRAIELCRHCAVRRGARFLRNPWDPATPEERTAGIPLATWLYITGGTRWVPAQREGTPRFGNRRTARRRDWWGILRFSALLLLGGGIIRVINGLWQVLIAATWGSAYMIREIRHARRANRR